MRTHEELLNGHWIKLADREVNTMKAILITLNKEDAHEYLGTQLEMLLGQVKILSAFIDQFCKDE